MKKVTALRMGRSKEKRLNVFLDGRFAFSLGAELAMKEDLQVGQELSTDQAEALTRSDRFQRCLDAAFRYLGYRPRSESEVRERLRRGGFEGDCIEAAIARLKELGLVDDVAFAQFWKENRESFRPRSQRLIKLELRRKGIVSEIIDRVTGDVDDGNSAYRTALHKSRHWLLSDYPSFRRRLGEYLKRRGFAYEVINHTVERIWQERGNSSG